jgi:uncharacterized protein YrrD
MLYGFDKLNDLPIEATDGEVGKVKDIYFDDHRWAARYLVVATGSWLGGRRVLISPLSIKSIDWEKNVAQVGLTRQQIRESPNIDTDRVSPLGLLPPLTNSPGRHGEASPDPRLRSAREVTGYRVEATDDSIGHVADLLLDSVSWAIRYLVVDTRNWLPGKNVVIPPRRVEDVDWSERVVTVDVTRDTVQGAPEYHSSPEFSRVHEANLYRYYRRKSTGSRPGSP